MTARNHKIFALLAATVIMLACAVPALAPASAPVVPTFDPNSINTVIVQTAEAAATQTALMSPPTSTSTATQTPTFMPTETPTATFIFILPTFTVPPTPVKIIKTDEDYACQILSQSPANDSVIMHSSVFETRWKVANTGKLPWDSTNADYRYSSGQKMHRTEAFDFELTISQGGTVDIIVDMQAPVELGTYTTTWKISVGRIRFCPMSITIVVN